MSKACQPDLQAWQATAYVHNNTRRIASTIIIETCKTLGSGVCQPKKWSRKHEDMVFQDQENKHCKQTGRISNRCEIGAKQQPNHRQAKHPTKNRSRPRTDQYVESEATTM
ncbi:unnamed protein product [Polarella glacialis]|uniref:Uncharacterized protein n=1 Tax=Polarella glacialis TaxID=89957 RepID=A0A813LHM1_POLGL|nr:unnamed protein product [Polarella glacialis]